MILKELLESKVNEYGNMGVVSHLISLYPDQRKNLVGYLEAVDQLMTLEPGDPGGFSLYVTMEMEPGPFDEEDFEPWGHVFGRNGKTNRDNDENGWLLPDNPTPEQLEWYDSESNWAMELSPWEELLAMEVVTSLDLSDALAHILWEITFFGFSNEEISARSDQLDKDYEDIKDEYD